MWASGNIIVNVVLIDCEMLGIGQWMIHPMPLVFYDDLLTQY